MAGDLSFLQFISEYRKNAEENAATEDIASQNSISRSGPDDDREDGCLYQDEDGVSEGFGMSFNMVMFRLSHYLYLLFVCLFVSVWIVAVFRAQTLPKRQIKIQTNDRMFASFLADNQPFLTSWQISRYASSLETRSLSVERRGGQGCEHSGDQHAKLPTHDLACSAVGSQCRGLSNRLLGQCSSYRCGARCNPDCGSQQKNPQSYLLGERV